MDTQNELKEFFVNFFVPIDNIPEDTAWRNSISMEARASMLIDNASLEDLSSLFNVCINENVLTLKLPAPLSVQVTAPTTFPAPTTVGYTYVDVLLHQGRKVWKRGNGKTTRNISSFVIS